MGRCSFGQGSNDDAILSVYGERRWLGLDSEPRDYRPQQPIVKTSLHRQRQPCHLVSSIYIHEYEVKPMQIVNSAMGQQYDDCLSI